MKKFLLSLVSILFAFCPLYSLQAYAISESQKSIISQYCGSIKQSLKTLQHADIDSRIKLGSRYETAISKFMTPMNLRIVKNNLSVSDLADLQQSFADYRTQFSSHFTAYSKILEELVAMDCQKEPENFYQKLLDAREAREKVRGDTISLNNILSKYQEAVKNLGKKYE